MITLVTKLEIAMTWKAERAGTVRIVVDMTNSCSHQNLRIRFQIFHVDADTVAASAPALIIITNCRKRSEHRTQCFGSFFELTSVSPVNRMLYTLQLITTFYVQIQWQSSFCSTHLH